jgi:hypothetical protein
MSALATVSVTGRMQLYVVSYETPQLALNNYDVIMLQVKPIKMSGNLMLSTGSMVQTRSLLTSISNEGQRVQELLIPCLVLIRKWVL